MMLWRAYSATVRLPAHIETETTSQLEVAMQYIADRDGRRRDLPYGRLRFEYGPAADHIEVFFTRGGVRRRFATLTQSSSTYSPFYGHC